MTLLACLNTFYLYLIKEQNLYKNKFIEANFVHMS